MKETPSHLIKTLLKNSCKISLKTSGCSMIPFIFPNDIATIDPVSGVLSPPQIYLYISDNQLILHRLYKRSSLSSELIIFKGDSNNFLDPAVHEMQIIGQLRSIRRTSASTIHRIKYQIKKLLHEI